MKKRIVSLMLAALMLALSACGAKQAAAGTMSAESAAAADMGYAMYEESAEAPAMKAENGAAEQSTLPAERKWIITGSVDAETEDLDAAMPKIRQHITALGGYIENEDSYNGSSYSGRRYRHSSLTARIPTDKLEEFTDAVAGAVNVVSQSRNARDVTLSYVDTETRIAALRLEQSRLMDMMEKAENMSDLLQIESRLTDVNYELERYSSTLRTLDNQIDYATISVYVSEVAEYTPAEEPTFLQRITRGFTSNLKSLWETIGDIVVFVITNLPALILWALVIVGAVKLGKKLRVRRKNKKAKPTEEQK